MPGVFITFEGTEGAGKSTQIQLLARRLSEAGEVCRTVREPGGTPISEEIRTLLKHSPHGGAITPETELLLMNASRAQLVREVIRPALARGEVVLADRFSDSTLAYQGYGRGLDLAAVRQVIEIAVGETRPALTLFLKVPLAVSEQRRSARALAEAAPHDRFESSERAFFERVEHGFEAIAAESPERFRVIDASASIEAVAIEIWRAVSSALRLRK
jgi:dTMP kinase